MWSLLSNILQNPPMQYLGILLQIVLLKLIHMTLIDQNPEALCMHGGFIRDLRLGDIFEIFKVRDLLKVLYKIKEQISFYTFSSSCVIFISFLQVDSCMIH
jgi:hypothetical protein